MTGKKTKIAVKVNILPNEIVENILSRVPVKTILRLKSVCKSWHSLFLDPYFIDLHLKTSKNNLFLMRVYKGWNQRVPALVVANTSSIVHSRLVLDPELDKKIKIVGSCDGIVCVQNLRGRYIDEAASEHIYLWNPGLRIVKNIKNPVRVVSERIFLGFGFDSGSMDYKVVRFEKSNGTTLLKEVEIYSLNSDSWRTVKVVASQNIMKFFVDYCESSTGVCIKGVHHWVVTIPAKHANECMDTMLIASFDMGEEVFKETMIPIKCIKKGVNINFTTQLFSYKGSLAMLILNESFPCYYKIWVMNDSWPESWTKLCKINILRKVYIHGFVQMKNEIIFSRFDYRTGQDCRIVFDVDKSEVNDGSSTAHVDLLNDATDIMSYKESLMLLGSNNLVHL